VAVRDISLVIPAGPTITDVAGTVTGLEVRDVAAVVDTDGQRP
jgi:hypothetical protein